MQVIKEFVDLNHKLARDSCRVYLAGPTAISHPDCEGQKRALRLHNFLIHTDYPHLSQGATAEREQPNCLFFHCGIWSLKDVSIYQAERVQCKRMMWHYGHGMIQICWSRTHTRRKKSGHLDPQSFNPF